MKAVHFGAGNIGRGFIGLVLHDAGYEVVFADVDAAVIDALANTPSYEVHEVGNNPRIRTVNNYRALNSSTNEADVVAEISTADIVTTAVGPSILRFVAPLLAAGIAERDAALPALQVMACENAISATDLLRAEVQKSLEASGRTVLIDDAIFANTAVDRIVPAQDRGDGLDVTVEEFFEWAIESGPFGDSLPVIPDAHFVDDLEPYIERKLFTVNTGHATTAYFGAQAGIEKISDALADDAIAAKVAAALEETSALLAAKHGLDPADLADYRATILRRFRNPALPDTVWRVGRQPLRKLSRHERFVGPAAEAAERGLGVDALVAAMAAALAFDDPEDEQSVQLQRLLREQDAAELTAGVTGLDPEHPLFPRVLAIVQARQAGL